MQNWLRVLCLTLSVVGVTSLHAAEFSTGLEAELQKGKSDDFVSAIVILPSAIDIRTLDFALHTRKATLADRHREVIDALKYNAGQNQPAFTAELDLQIEHGSVKGYTPYWIENLVVLYAQKSFIESLRDRGDVEFVTLNFEPELIEPMRIPEKEGADPRPPRNPLDNETTTAGQNAIGTTRVNRELGITGQGVLVANCDTGVDGNHPALSARWRGNFAPAAHCWRDALGSAPTFPADGNGHGTHVMGTITGRAIAGNDTNTVGGAPNAQWIATNTINQGTGSAFDNDVIADYQWFADPDGNPGTLDDVPDAIQNSWGVNGNFSGYTQCDTRWNTFILNCEAVGPVVSWSAGNEGASGLRTPAIHSFNAYQIFSVGAVDAQDGAAPFPIASFSSLGPTPCTPASPDNIKPEISAPGVNIYSSVPGGGYDGTYSGTSMAGPHVAGVVALMREACPDCDHITIKDAIMQTALDQGPAGQDNTYGHGVIRAYEAVLAVSNLGRIGGVVTDGVNPLSGVKVKITSGTNQTLTDAAGQYYLPLSSGTYSVEYSKFGYLPQTIPGLTVVVGDTTIQNVTLTLAPQGVLSGTVTSCSGGPAAGATVELLNVPVTPTTTNGAGFYSFNIPQGLYDVRASGAGCGVVTVTGVNVGANTTQNLTLPSDPAYECSTPDANGYSACENGDASGPAFSWFEIAPSAGGPGTASTIISDDAGQSVPLPFTYRHYGVNYTSVWICSNGFVSFTTTSTAFTNGGMPSTTIGAGVAALWDDLYPPDGGQIAYYHNAAENAFIIEWYNISHYPSGSNAPETFQIWLYNSATNQGPNGDSQVRVQYLNTTATASATVGIGNSTVGTQYVMNGSLDVSSQGLEDNRVISFNGHTVIPVGTLSGLVRDNNSLSPLGSVTVTRLDNSQTTQTAANGLYSMAMATGTYDFSFSKSNYVVQTVNSVVISENATTTINVDLVPFPILQGSVTEAGTGNPLSGVLVTRVGDGQTTTTAGDGTYSMQFASGTYDFTFTLTGYAPESISSLNFVDGQVRIENLQLIALPVVTFADEDFETGAPGWTHDSPVGWVDNWHISTERANSGVSSYKCGDVSTGTYSSLSDARLTSPVWSNLPASASLSFVTQIESELSAAFPDSAYDGGMIELSVNGGAWTLVEPSPGYNKTFRYRAGGANPYSGPVAGARCIAGSITTWTTYSLDLSTYEAQSVQVRFRFGSDAGTNLEGWYIDDVVGSGFGTAVPEAPFNLTIIANGSNLDFQWGGTAPMYQLLSASSSDGPYDTLEGFTSGTTMSIPIPVNGSRYFVVVATNGLGLSSPSTPVGLISR